MLKIGIIGSGFGLYGLLPAFNSLKGCQVVCICGTQSRRLLDYSSSIGLEKIYTDWQLMLQNEKLDAVAIAVPPYAQYDIAKAAIKKGLHVFAEKPLAKNVKQAQELAKLAKSKGITHAVDFIFPEIRLWQKAKQLINDKAYGELKYISVNWDFLSYDIAHKLTSWKTDISKGGGALAYYFSHCLYYLEDFAGDITKVQSVLSLSKESKNGGEVGVDLLLKFAGGIVGQAHLNCNAKGLNNHRLMFICQKATIILGNQGSYTEDFKLEIYQHGKITKFLTDKEKSLNKKDDSRVKYVKKIAERFVKACSQGRQMTPSFVQGLRVQKLVEQIRTQQI